MRTTLKTMFSLLMMLTMSIHSWAAIEAHNFDNELERKRYQSMIEEMRCPKCQNQNLAGSDSPISTDLRHEIYEMIKAGKSDLEIVNFMVERYGEFVLYRPRVSPVTYFLWGAPVALLGIGGVVLLVMLRRRRQLLVSSMSNTLSDDESARLKKLLSDNPENNNEGNKK